MPGVHDDGARDRMRQTEEGIWVRIPPGLALAGDVFLRILQGRCAAIFSTVSVCLACSILTCLLDIHR